MTLDQITGPLRAVLGVLATYLAIWGLLPPEVAAQLPDTIIQSIILISAIVTMASAVWSWWKNKRTNLAKVVASTPGVVVGVDPMKAPADMKALARDPNAVDVVPTDISKA